MTGPARTAVRSAPPGARGSGELLDLMRGFVVAKSLFVAADLTVADLLAGGPRPVAELAAATETHPDALRRLLRALCGVEVFTDAGGDRFGLGRLGPGLLTAGPHSVRNWLLVNGGPVFRAFDGMPEAVRSGRPAFADLFGRSFFDHMKRSTQDGQWFHAAMDEISRHTADALLAAYDFRGVTSVVDVGGGRGGLLAALLRAHASLRGTVFDRPEVVRTARATVAAAGVADRCELRGGDFFRSVPAGADCYLLSWILHDWDDSAALRLLRSCRRAIPATGRLLLVEALLPPADRPHFAHFGDLVMLVALGGRERTEEQYAALLAAAGFRLARVIPTGEPRSLLEAVPW